MKSINGKIFDDSNTVIGHYTLEYNDDEQIHDFNSVFRIIPKEFIDCIIEQYEMYPNKIYEYINYKLNYHRVSNTELELTYGKYKINMNFEKVDNWKKIKSIISH